MTKVSGLDERRVLRAAFLVTLTLWGVLVPRARAGAEGTFSSGPAEALYLQLGRVGLDPARVYRVRGAAIDRSAIHITLEDGTIAFTQDVMGRITGAFFEGDGEILLTPRDEVERKSMSLFTGMAILEERFATAYFRFNDQMAAELRPDLRTADDGAEFVTKWGDTAQNLARLDAMRILVTFSRLLPVDKISQSGQGADADSSLDSGDRILHARLQGTKLGVFDIYFDSTAGEQVQAGQARTAENGTTYYDVWTSFSAGQLPNRAEQIAPRTERSEKGRGDWVAVHRYVIATRVEPPKRVQADARLQLDVTQGGPRMLVFELSRFLQIERVEMDGQAVEFIHNPAIEGTQLSRRGNDLVAVVLPEPTRAGQKMELRFVYAGEVLAEAGSGLLYVGARGTWYPNRGMSMADFDLEFHYPPEWTLVATGKPEPVAVSPTASPNNPGEQSMRWVSERPIPLAGFNLGKYKVATAKAGDVTVETYATSGVERDFPTAPIQIVRPNPLEPLPRNTGVHVIAPASPSPARNALPLAERTARAVEYYAQRFGPYPYSRLALTQMPGHESQGWPGLVFLSSYAFLNEGERTDLHFDPQRAVFVEQIPAHETAHQWWGDLVGWSTYRDQWLSEGLANYCALMMLQEKNPAGFREIMEKYRRDLLAENKDGAVPRDAGPVTLGVRLLSSHFPEGYEAISYGRGTWLFHMLRTMLQDGWAQDARTKGGKINDPEEPFVRSLRKVRERYQGKSISTRELLEVFAEDLPPALRYEGKDSLQWFLEGWINGTDLPKLELKAVKFTTKGTSTIVSGTIIQKDASANLVTSVPVYAVMAGKRLVFLGRVFADGEETTFHLTAASSGHKIVLDPNGTILTSPK